MLIRAEVEIVERLTTIAIMADELLGIDYK
jgi:hypothetical protein